MALINSWRSSADTPNTWQCAGRPRRVLAMAGCSFVEHGHRPVHAHFVGRGRNCASVAGGTTQLPWSVNTVITPQAAGELPALMAVPGKVQAVAVVVGGHHGIAGRVFVGIDINVAHGPNLPIYDLIVQAGRGADDPECRL